MNEEHKEGAAHTEELSRPNYHSKSRWKNEAKRENKSDREIMVLDKEGLSLIDKVKMVSSFNSGF